MVTAFGNSRIVAISRDDWYAYGCPSCGASSFNEFQTTTGGSGNLMTCNCGYKFFVCGSGITTTLQLAQHQLNYSLVAHPKPIKRKMRELSRICGALLVTGFIMWPVVVQDFCIPSEILSDFFISILHRFI